MICKECGTELPDIAKFCYRCGKTVGSVDLQDDFDPFGTDDGVMPVKAVAPAVAKADESVKEVDVEVVEETVEEVDVEEAVAPVETVAEAAKEASVKEEAEAESEKTEETTEEKEMIEGAEEAEEAAKANKGFKIMRNPDYVPPEVEEEKPFYEEHVNYEELREQRAAKMEKRMQILSIFIGIAVLIGIGIFAYTK